MRRLLLILAAVALSGCAAQTPPAPQEPPSLSQFTTASAAPALSFEPPVRPDYPLLGLDRAARERSAFFGYVGPATEYYFISTYDEQGGWCPWDGGYDRLAVTAQAGSVTR